MSRFEVSLNEITDEQRSKRDLSFNLKVEDYEGNPVSDDILQSAEEDFEMIIRSVTDKYIGTTFSVSNVGLMKYEVEKTIKEFIHIDERFKQGA